MGGNTESTADTQGIATELGKLLQWQLGDSRLPHKHNGQMGDCYLPTVCTYIVHHKLTAG